MRLPNRERAEVPPAKLVSYLLSETHPVGRTKARYFRSVVFTTANATLLVAGLLEIARAAPIKATEASPFGMKYILDGVVPTPQQSTIRLRTIWIIEHGREHPRLVTAYPAPEAWEDDDAR